MPIARSKAASRAGNVDIHQTVNNWWQVPNVPYVAHAFLANGNIIQLRPPVAAQAVNQPANHPDQLYWRAFNGGHHQVAIPAIGNAIQNAGGVGNILSIDIDCKLMPCATDPQACLFAVPGYMRNYYGLANVALRIFSHADENMGGQGTGHLSSKRVILCNTSDTPQQLQNAYNNHDGWGWVP